MNLSCVIGSSVTCGNNAFSRSKPSAQCWNSSAGAPTGYNAWAPGDLLSSDRHALNRPVIVLLSPFPFIFLTLNSCLISSFSRYSVSIPNSLSNTAANEFLFSEVDFCNSIINYRLNFSDYYFYASLLNLISTLTPANCFSSCLPNTTPIRKIFTMHKLKILLRSLT